MIRLEKQMENKRNKKIGTISRLINWMNAQINYPIKMRSPSNPPLKIMMEWKLFCAPSCENNARFKAMFRENPKSILTLFSLVVMDRN